MLKGLVVKGKIVGEREDSLSKFDSDVWFTFWKYVRHNVSNNVCDKINVFANKMRIN